jgi:S1-C subfamily serine protease
MKTKWIRGGVGVVLIAALTLVAAPAGAGTSDHGYMGVYMQKLTRDIRDGLDLDVSQGVLVSGVEDDSPAEKAGLEDGDVIIEVNGNAVRNPDDLRNTIRDMSPGTEVEVLIIRDGDRRTLDLVLGEAPDSGVFDFGSRNFRWFSGDDDDDYVFARIFGGPRLGVRASELNDDLASYFDAEPGEGILVLEVMDESIAAKAGVKSGDVIIRVNDESVGNVEELREVLGDFEEGDTFDLTVLRKGHTETLAATMDDQSARTFWSGNHPHRIRLPRVDREDIDEVLDELRGEIKELKREIQELKDGD